jgi:hypothetical protein
MSDAPFEPIQLKLTDEEFVALHAEASAAGVPVNEFIVATLRQHLRMEFEIQAEQREEAAQAGEDAAAVPSPS